MSLVVSLCSDRTDRVPAHLHIHNSRMKNTQHFFLCQIPLKMISPFFHTTHIKMKIKNHPTQMEIWNEPVKEATKF